MISKMGIVTLFCNIAAAIGFGVFALTKSAILKEFGVVAGINIMLLFIISIILIPAALSYLPDPKERHTRYLTNRWLTTLLDWLESWALHHKKTIFITTLHHSCLFLLQALRVFVQKLLFWMICQKQIRYLPTSSFLKTISKV